MHSLSAQLVIDHRHPVDVENTYRAHLENTWTGLYWPSNGWVSAARNTPILYGSAGPTIVKTQIWWHGRVRRTRERTYAQVEDRLQKNWSSSSYVKTPFWCFRNQCRIVREKWSSYENAAIDTYNMFFMLEGLIYRRFDRLPTDYYWERTTLFDRS